MTAVGDREGKRGEKSRETNGEIQEDLSAVKRAVDCYGFQVADSKAIRLPTLKELIGYPTTYDRITTMPSVLLHLLRFDVDNNISQESIGESVGGTSESYPPADFVSDAEKASIQSLEETTEEIGYSWLRQASESKAKSRVPKKQDISVGDQEGSVTNTIQRDEGKREEFRTSIYLKPTTMRGIPLANLTPSPVMRGFYVTKNHDLLTPTSANVFTSKETTVEQQTETILNPDVSTTDEIVTVAHNYQNVAKLDAANDDANVIINDRETDIPEEKFSTLSDTLAISTEDSGNVENLSDYAELDTVRSPTSESASKKGKSLRDNVNRSTTSSNIYVPRSTTATRHAIALAVSRYNELTTPLWTGKRILIRKRNRTTASPIKDSIRRTESGFIRATTSSFRNSSDTVSSTASSTSISATRELSATPTSPSNSTFASETTISSEALNLDGNFVAFIDAMSKDQKNHATTDATSALTDSITAAIRSIATIASTIDDRAAITVIPNVDVASVNTSFPVTITTATIANASAITNHTVSANIVPTTRAIEADFTNTTTVVGVEVDNTYTTADYSVVAATSNTRATATESMITITPAIASTGVEIANYSAVTIPITGDNREVATEPAITVAPETANTEIETTSAIANYSSIATTDSTREVATAAAIIAATREATNTEPEAASTIGNYSEILSTIPTTRDTHEVAVEPAVTIKLKTTDTEVETALTTVNYPTINTSTSARATETVAVAATIASTTYSSTAENVSSIADSRANATVSETTSNLAHADDAGLATTTTPAIVISPTSTDPDVIATSLDMNIPRTVTFAVTETSATTNAFDIISAIPPEILVTNTNTIPTSTSVPSTLTTKSSTISVATPNILNLNDDSKVLSDTVTTRSAQSIKIPTYKMSHISLTSITTAIPSSFPNSNSTMPTIETIASIRRTDEPAVTSKSIQISPTLLSIVIPINDTTTVASEMSTIPTMPAISRGSIAMNSTLRTTITNVDESTSASSEAVSNAPELKTDAKGVTPTVARTRARDRTNSRYNVTNSQFERRTSGQTVHRRVINRPDERPATRQPTERYSRRRVVVHRERPYRPSGYASSSRVVEENRRRRIMQKRLRTEAVSGIARSNEKKTDDVRNVTEKYDRTASTSRRTKVISKRVREKIGMEERVIGFPAENNTMLSVQLSNSTGDETPRVHREERRMSEGRKLVLKRIKFQSNETSTTKQIDPLSDRLSTTARTDKSLFNGEKTRRRMRVVLKSIKPKFEGKNSTAEEANLNSTDKSLQRNLRIDRKLSDERNKKRRMRIVLKSIEPKIKERNSTIEETSTKADSNHENLQGNFSNYPRVGNYLLNKKNRRIRVVLRSIRPKYKEENSTIKEDASSVFADDTLHSNFSGNFRMTKNLSNENNARRKIKVVLRNVRPKSEGEDFAEETGVDSESKGEDLQGDFSSKLYVNDNLPDEDEMRRGMTVVLKEISPRSKERETTTEETSESPVSVDDNDFSGEEKTMASKSEEGQMTTEQPLEYGAELHTTETSVWVEENTDRPSNEVKPSVRGSGESINRRLGIGHSDRQRRPTTASPLINTLSSTLNAHRRSRPVVATLSPRMDFIDTFESTEPYSKLNGAEDDQKAELSDQSIRAQEFAVTLADPPFSSSDIGRTPLLKDAVRRKISTTVAPRTDPVTTSRTISRYGADFRSRQRHRVKDKPAVNTTVRPRRPPIVDYDYYEDEVPIVVDKSVLDSKLFLTSKGTIRCLDQGNFPHPYSCKKFITCARMVNGQVIGTEYTCPAKLSFDPVGGICNWSAGLGCKD